VILKIYRFVAKQVGAKHGGLMIRAPGRIRLKQYQAAFFAGCSDDLVFLVLKNSRSIVRIKIALEKPFPVGGGVVILHHQPGILDLHRDDTVGILILRRVIRTVAGGKPGDSVGIDGSTAAAPNSTAFRNPWRHRMIHVVQVHGRHRLDGRQPERVSVEVHGPRLALLPLDRGLQVRAIGQVEDVQHPAAVNEVHRALAVLLRIGRSPGCHCYRRVREIQVAGGLAAHDRRHLRRQFEPLRATGVCVMFLPQQRSVGSVHGIKVVGNARDQYDLLSTHSRS